MKWVAKALFAFMLLGLAAWSLLRWLGPTDAQEAALVTMRETLPPVQRNAFAALLDRTETLAEYDGLRHSFGLRFDMPLPAYQHGKKHSRFGKDHRVA